MKFCLKKCVSVLLCLAFLALLAGCGSSGGEEQTTGAEGESVTLYYLNADGNGFEKVDCTLENPDDPLTASYEILHRLSDADEIYTDQYKTSLSENVEVNGIKIKDGEETVDFGAGYNQLDNVEEALCRASVVLSLLQLSGVDSVRFTVNGTGLRGADDMPIGSMNADSFAIGGGDDIFRQTEKLSLYYANADGDGLVLCEREVTAEENMSLETAAILALMEQPEEADARVALPDGLSVNRTQVRNNVCYVDLSEEIENVVIGVEEEVTVYSMVNTLASIGNISQIRFTVNGTTVKKLNDFKKFGETMDFAYSLTEETSENK